MASKFGSVFLMGGIILAGLLASAFINPLLAWGGIFALMVGILLLGKPIKLLFFGGVWMVVQPLISGIIGGVGDYLDELFVVGCVVVLFGLRSMRGRLAFRHRGFAATYLGLLVVIATSSFFVDIPPIIFVNSMLTYFSFPVILLIAYQFRSERVVNVFIKGSLFFFGLQLVLNAGWILRVNPLPNRHAMVRNMFDICHGSVGRADFLAYATIGLIFLFWSAVRYTPSGFWRKCYFFAVPLAALQFRLTYTSHALVYLPMSLGIYLLAVDKKLSRMIKVTCLFLLIGGLGFGVERTLTSGASYGAMQEDAAEIFSKRNLERRWDRFLLGPKMQLVQKVTIDWLQSSPKRWLVGMGAGNGTSAVGMTRVSSGAFELLADYYLTQTGQQERFGSSVTNSTTSGLVSLWSEVGLLGFCLFQLLCIIPLIRVFRHVWNRRYENTIQRVLAEAYLPTMLMFMSANFLTDLYWSPFWTYVVWVWSGFVFDPFVNENKSTGEATSPVEPTSSAENKAVVLSV